MNIELDDLFYVHAVGVIGGSIWSFGSTECKNGSYTRITWPEKIIKYPGSVSISISEIGAPTTPESFEKLTAEELENKIKRGFENLKIIEEKAKKKYQSDLEPTAKINRKKTAKVFINGEAVFEVEGEHIQFQVDYKKNGNFLFSIYGSELSSDKEPVGKYDVKLSKSTELLLRFGS
ncbi:MAG: hypothetical protein KDI68_16140 [Gammaproteobacteria bacterium]|nr:hypothetical protein [Gammaproteobacteria bacterium]